MSLKVYGAQLATSDIDGSTRNISLRFRANSNQVIKLFSTWFVFYNSPAFMSLSLKLHNDQNGLPGSFIVESTNSYAPADIFALPYSIKGLGFEFDDIAILGTAWYHLVPYAVGYTGSDSSHIAWAKGWPDNEYRTNLNITYESIGVNPYRLAPIGAAF